MSALATAGRRIMDRFGVSEEEAAEILADGSNPEIDFEQPLPGRAADMLEIFLADSGPGVETDDGLLWYPMIRAGTHALRPGTRGQKVRQPLKVIAGKSQDSLSEIGLQDLVDAFYDDAVDFVTVPENHDNKPLENTGFIRQMKITDLEVQTGPQKGKKLPHLVGGYDFTEPDVKAKVKRGTIPSRSCGILYNYENTETGKEYPSVVEHVALTVKPWIRGMPAFGRKLSENKSEPVAMRFSDETPAEDDVEAQLAEGDATVTWKHEDSPNWLREQINQILSEARAEKRRQRQGSSTLYVEDPIPYYRCSEAKSESTEGNGRALISDGYGEGANYWVASFRLDDGNVAIDDFGSWEAVKNVYVSDDRDAPERKNQPLGEDYKPTLQDQLQLAQVQRLLRSKGLVDGDASYQELFEKACNIGAVVPEVLRKLAGVATDDLGENNNQGGDPRMAVETQNGGGTLELSEEARSLIKAAEDKAAATQAELDRQKAKIERLTESGQVKETESFIDFLKGIGLDEKHGFAGLLSEIETICLADDLEPAIVSEKFSENGDTEVSLSVTDVLKRVFKAIKLNDEGKVSLGEQLEQPSDGEEGGEGESKPDGGDGKPAAGDDQNELSVEGAKDRADEMAEGNPEIAAMTGLGKKPADSGSGKED